MMIESEVYARLRKAVTMMNDKSYRYLSCSEADQTKDTSESQGRAKMTSVWQGWTSHGALLRPKYKQRNRSQIYRCDPNRESTLQPSS